MLIQFQFPRENDALLNKKSCIIVVAAAECIQKEREDARHKVINIYAFELKSRENILNYSRIYVAARELDKKLLFRSKINAKKFSKISDNNFYLATKTFSLLSHCLMLMHFPTYCRDAVCARGSWEIEN